jgi:hypothetical protein
MSLSTEIDEAARAAIEEAHALTPVAIRCAAERGWAGELRSWRARVSRWGNPRDPHVFPAWALPIIVEITGRDPFTAILLRAALKRRRPAMRKVPPRERGRGVA